MKEILPITIFVIYAIFLILVARISIFLSIGLLINLLVAVTLLILAKEEK